jgi:hypothetical protein
LKFTPAGAKLFVNATAPAFSDCLIGMIAGRPSVEHLKIGVQNSVPAISNFNAIRVHDPIIPSTPLDDIYSKEASRGECSIAALFPIVAPTRPAGAN